jgi:hypothetical protein
MFFHIFIIKYYFLFKNFNIFFSILVKKIKIMSENYYEVINNMNEFMNIIN